MPPQQPPAAPAPDGAVVDQKVVNLIVGAAAIALPVLLWLLSWQQNTCFMTSISHFYYTRLGGDILVGILATIGLLMIFAYRYHGNPSDFTPAMKTAFGVEQGMSAYSRWTTGWMKVAGISALGVALVPTGGIGCIHTGETARYFLPVTTILPPPAPGEVGFWTDARVDGTPGYAPFGGWDWLHFASAGVLFILLAYFSLFVFTKVQTLKAVKSFDPETGAYELTREKIIRNGIYRVMGGLILLSIVVLLVKWLATETLLSDQVETDFLDWWNGWHLTFRLEALGLVAFGISWLVKGKPWGLLAD